MKLILSLVLLLAIQLNADELGELTGPNVCSTVEEQTIETITETANNYDERQMQWCLTLPIFRCTTIIPKTEAIFSLQNKTERIKISKCCDGYGRKGNHCVPICDCMNLNVTCKDARNPCNCLIDGKCPFKCPPNRFGVNCTQLCTCNSGGTCHYLSGQCHYVTPSHHTCFVGRYGPNCSLKCTCENGAICSSKTGQCQCKPGWTGHACSVPCPYGYYGQSCSEVCLCKNNATCRKTDGHCICAPGFMGTHCDNICQDGNYGLHCLEVCSCKSDRFFCNNTLGCVCREGFTGDDCSIRNGSSLRQERSEAGVESAVWMIVTIVSIIVIIMVAVYCTRIRNFETIDGNVDLNGTSETIQNPAYGHIDICTTSNSCQRSKPLPPRPVDLAMSKLDLSTTSCEKDCRVENVEHTNEEDHLYAEIGSARKSKLSDDFYEHIKDTTATNSLKSDHHRDGMQENNFSVNDFPENSPEDNERQSFRFTFFK